jgi:hydroxypyruvate isomerase
MLKFAANLSMLFTEMPFLERFAAARDAGFDAVEYLFPYAFSKDLLSSALKSHGLKQVLFNLPAGDWDAGERGIACNPDRVSEFRGGVELAIEYAHALACSQINCLAGKVPDGVSVDMARRTLIENLKWASSELANADIRLLIEPINSHDITGFFLTRTQQALSLIEEVRSGNLFVQYDIYHAQRIEGELAATLKNHLSSIAHIQLADNPGRHEPGTGEINYDWLLPYIDAIGYGGFIGCEYKPAGSTTHSLGWLLKHTR